MLGNFRFDDMVERLSRRVAGRTSRRGAIGRLGAVLAGAAIVPLLPVDRRGRVSRANAASAPEGRIRAPNGSRRIMTCNPATIGGTARSTAISAIARAVR
ncbi:hypothetical protein ACFSS8_23360 [Paracoccus kondratievae]